jgi:hypothetical protein
MLIGQAWTPEEPPLLGSPAAPRHGPAWARQRRDLTSSPSSAEPNRRPRPVDLCHCCPSGDRNPLSALPSRLGVIVIAFDQEDHASRGF